MAHLPGTVVLFHSPGWPLNAAPVAPAITPFGYRTVVLVQPQGTGKSNVTAEQFGCCGIVDEWHDHKTTISGYLHLTNVMPRDVPAGVEVILSQPPSPNQATA